MSPVAIQGLLQTYFSILRDFVFLTVSFKTCFEVIPWSIQFKRVSLLGLLRIIFLRFYEACVYYLFVIFLLSSLFAPSSISKSTSRTAAISFYLRYTFQRVLKVCRLRISFRYPYSAIQSRLLFFFFLIFLVSFEMRISSIQFGIDFSKKLYRSSNIV